MRALLLLGRLDTSLARQWANAGLEWTTGGEFAGKDMLDLLCCLIC